MKSHNFYVFLFIVFGTAMLTFGQTPAITPPIDDNDVVKITTSLIQIDVVVTDKKGNQVAGLKPEDFEIYENDELVKVSHFSYVQSAKSNPANNSIVSLNTGSNMRSNMPPLISQVRRTVAIVIDDAALPISDVNYVKKALLKFITEETQPGDLIAVIKTTGSLGILQQFTTDKPKLIKAIEEIKWNPVMGAQATAFAPIEVSVSEEVSATTGSMLSELAARSDSVGSENGEDALASLKPTDITNTRITDSLANKSNIENFANNFRNEELVLGTLNVLIRTIMAMDAMPGRKSIIFVSPGINTDAYIGSVGKDTASGRDFSINTLSYESKQLLQKVTDAANRAAISIYPLDTRGVTVIGLQASDSTRGGMFASKTAGQIDAEVVENRNSYKRSQQTLKILAEETGGKAFLDNNDLGKGLADTLRTQGDYYLLAYQPDSDTFDAEKRRYNKLTVKVKRPDVNVNYRSGFFNVAEQTKSNYQVTEDQEFVQRMLSPYRYENVHLDISSVYAGAGNSQSSIRSFINISPNDLKFIDLGGKKIARFDLLAFAFNENGIPVARFGRNFTVNVPASEFQKFLKGGISCNLLFTVKETGVHTIKVAVRDSATKKVGSMTQQVNIPDFEKSPIAISGILLQNFTADEWKNRQTNAANATNKMLSDTSYRRFKRGTILNYAYTLYISPFIKKLNTAKVSGQVILFKDALPVLTGDPTDIGFSDTKEVQKLTKQGAFVLDPDLPLGKYTLQITVGTPGSKNPEVQAINFDLIN